MKKTSPEHASMESFGVQDNCLQVGGISLMRLVECVGSTPFYAYDRQSITERVTLLRRHLPEGILLHYAMKANPMPAVVQHLASIVDGIDVASVGEMKVALDTILTPDKISFAGPGKRFSELRRAVAAGITINVESEQELRVIVDLGECLGITPSVAIRVNPNFELKSSGMKMGGGAKPFGIDAERVPGLLRLLVSFKLNFVGLHIFSGSQNLNSAAIQEAQLKSLQLGIRLTEHIPISMPLLNIGGGFGVPYFPGEVRLDLAVIGENMQSMIQDFRKQLPETLVAIELGRYMVAEAGVYVCRILERKESRGKIFLITDGGMHHHLAASGNLGQVIRKNFPVIIGNRVRDTEKEVVSIVGPLCTPLDLLAEEMMLPKAIVGDLIVILQSGAYGLSASPVAFLNHPLPEEILV